MKGVIVHRIKPNSKKIALPAILFNFVLLPGKSGLYGFAAFFTVLVFIKLWIFIAGYNQLFIVDTNDVIISLAGFGVMFLFRLAQSLKRIIFL